MYTNLTNAQAKKLAKDLQKKCIKLTDGTWEIKTTNLPKSKDKIKGTDSSKERTSFSPDKRPSWTEQGEKDQATHGGLGGSKRNMGKEPEYKNKKTVPTKRLGFF